jgi:hypothetical protein
MAHRRKRKRANKFFRVLCHDDIDLCAYLLQLTDQLNCLVGCNAPTDSDDNTPVK